MLDWPEHSQTSPTSTSFTVWLAPPLAWADSTKGPPAAVAGRAADQWPEASAVAVADAPPSDTVTVSPGEAWPQTGMGWSRCRTARSLNMACSSGVGWAAAAEAQRARIRANRTRMDQVPCPAAAKAATGAYLGVIRWITSRASR